MSFMVRETDVAMDFWTMNLWLLDRVESSSPEKRAVYWVSRGKPGGRLLGHRDEGCRRENNLC
jgi:hypothetical protein